MAGIDHDCDAARIRSAAGVIFRRFGPEKDSLVRELSLMADDLDERDGTHSHA